MGNRGRASAAELSVVRPEGAGARTPKSPKTAPRGLGKAGKQLWNEITADFNLENAGERVLLEHAARAADDMENQSPGVRLQSRAFIVRTLQKLGVGQ